MSGHHCRPQEQPGQTWATGEEKHLNLQTLPLGFVSVLGDSQAVSGVSPYFRAHCSVSKAMQLEADTSLQLDAMVKCSLCQGQCPRGLGSPSIQAGAT